MGKITIDKLAQLVVNEFREMGGRMDKGFEEVNERFQQVDERINNLKAETGLGFKRVNERLDHVDARLGRVEQDISEIRKHFVYRHEFEDLMDRVKYLEEKLGIESGK